MKCISVSMVTSLILMSILKISNKNSMMKKNPSSAFECGFENLKSTKQKFSSQYFMIAILFLLFDLEIVMITPSPITENWSQKSASVIFMFMISILISLCFEWISGGIEWSK